MGCGLVNRGSRAAGRRVDGCCRGAAALLQRGNRDHQRPRGGGRCRPVGDDARVAGVGACDVMTGLALGPAASTWAAHPDDRRCRRDARRGQPRACRGRRLGAAYVLGDGRLSSPGGLASWSPEAGAFGAVGTAVGCFDQRRRVLLNLPVWFGVELISGGGQVGLAERVLGGAQAVLATNGGPVLPEPVPPPPDAACRPRRRWYSELKAHWDAPCPPAPAGQDAVARPAPASRLS